MNTILHQGHNAEVLRQYPDCHFDAIVTDPPYGIEFLGKDWDSHTGAIETWQQCLRVLKPGGHLLAFSAARTYHHLATNIESTGFEIRDQLMWIYSSGFPKAQDIGKALDKRAGKMDPNYGSKKTLSQGNEIVSDFATGARCGKCNRTFNADIIKDCEQDPCGMKYQHQTPQGQRWAGWKTALKPGHEPIVMARKPMKGSTIDCVLKHGVGALNIDQSRIPYEDQQDLNTYINNIAGPLERSTASAGDTIQMHEGRTGFKVQKGKVKRPQAGNRTASFSFGHIEPQSGGDGSPEFEANPQGRYPSNVMGDIPDYQKYFYCPKVSRRERHCGCEDIKASQYSDKKGNGIQRICETCGTTQMKAAECKCATKSWVMPMIQGNNHPTVKPVALMRYLIQLVTPVNSIVLDPFMGSGSTGMAASELGHTFVGIDLDPAYVEIAERRIQGWIKPKESCHSTFNKLFD